MSEPYPTYTTATPTPVFSQPTAVDLTQESMEQLERQLTAALVAIWKAQGKRKKIITLAPPR